MPADDLAPQPTAMDKDEERQPETPPLPPEPRESAWTYRAFARFLGILALLMACGAAVCVAAIILYSHFHHSPLIDRLKNGPLSYTTNIYAAPRTLAVGDAATPEEVAGELRRSGYGVTSDSRAGYFTLAPDAIDIYPGPNSCFRGSPAHIVFHNGAVSEIRVSGGRAAGQYPLEPRLITNVDDEGRQQRQVTPFSDLPPVLVQAVISTEDKKFFQHSGFDLMRILKAAFIDLRHGRKKQGASTLSMQLARSLWLDRGKAWRRKFNEFLLTSQLEERFNKQQIFEAYANEIYLGRSGTYNIHGFGAAAQAFFGKDVKQLTLPEAALLAGIIQRPSLYNPYRNPAAARQRRAVVLTRMRENGYITRQQQQAANAVPIRLAARTAPSPVAPYYVDLVMDELQSRLRESDQATAQNIYTSLDIDLQRCAEDAVRTGMAEVDRKLRKDTSRPQVALVAMDPHSGEIKALVGGRNYRESQLNRTNALRQPGSAFKPFVYAAALETGVTHADQVITPATTVLDEPTTFADGDNDYAPGNFHDDFYGLVTLRRALMKSLNVAAVKVAELAGLKRVVDLAERAGMTGRVKPTPALALGAYDVTPLQIAGAYTIFANQGRYERPHVLKQVVSFDGADRYRGVEEAHQALDPRIAYLMVSMLQDVVHGGTAAGLAGRGITAPVAAKTGTSRDGWFAGFTTSLLCVVWVGYDDGRELGLEGSRSAMPVWADFMKQALQLPAYRRATEFPVPAGLTRASVDPDTGMLATEYCPRRQTDVFVNGTQPPLCTQHDQYNFVIPTVTPLSQMHVPQTVQ